MFGTVSDFDLSGGCSGTDIIHHCTRMVKYRSSRADFWTNLRQISLRVFFTPKNGENDNMVQQNTTMSFFVKKSLRSYMPHTKVGKKMFRYDLLNFD